MCTFKLEENSKLFEIFLMNTFDDFDDDTFDLLTTNFLS